MKIDVISIFPEYLKPLELSLVGKAVTDGVIDLNLLDLRSATVDKHKTVDDTPYGGGPGMVMKAEPWGQMIDSVLADSSNPILIVPTPSGLPFTQHIAKELSMAEHLIFAPARYEGIDSRVVAHYKSVGVQVMELSIGDYVLAGGEVAVLVMVEAIARLIPGVLGNAESVQDDSFAPGPMQDLLEGPVFTKPPIWRDQPVPEVLLSGNHAKIAAWRLAEAHARTAEFRPDLTQDTDSPKAK